MSLLDSYTIAQIRADQLSALPDTCAILAPTHTMQGTGHWSDSWGTVAGTVACRLRPEGVSGETLTAEQMTAPQAYVLSLAYDGTLAAGYRVLYGGGTYEVTGAIATTSWDTVTRARVVEAKP
jgi:hypothetical protein